MQMLIPSQTALVLGGGGAKGAYEIGAMEALAALGIRAGSVFGVSVGALNAAIYAQGSIQQAAELWEEIRFADVVSDELLRDADDIENLFDHPEKLKDLAARYAQHKGLDVSPFAALLARYIDEDAMRRSPVHFALTATRFPTLSVMQKRLEDMEAGTLHSWIMASCACFPLFPIVTIGNDRYIDGGFSDNTPVSMALRSGARHIIAVDIGKNRSHTQYDRRPNVTYIRTSQPLGGLMNFDPARSRRNRIIGYNDTLRAFGRLRGVRYSFDPVDVQALHTRAQDFLVRLSQAEARLQTPSALNGRSPAAPLFSLLEEDLPPKPDALDYLLRACELCASIAGLDPAQVFTFSSFVDQLRSHLPLEQAQEMLGSLLGMRIGSLFSSPQPEKKLIISCLYHLLQREDTLSSIAMHTLSAFPREMLCAMTLKELF